MSQGIGLHQHLNLSQTLSPQMQQSLQYLQAPVMELRSLMQQEMQANPVLEDVTDVSEPTDDDWDKELDEIRQDDEDWREYFAQSRETQGTFSSDAEKKRQFLFDSQIAQPSLSEHLLDQLLLSTDNATIQMAGEEIIGNIDDDGFLKSEISEMASNANLAPEVIQTALDLIQTFHPPGIAARNLRECLLIQLSLRGLTESIEYQIVDKNLQLLARKRFQELSKKYKVSVERIREAAALIGRLQPKPGLAFSPDEPQNIVQAEAAIFQHEGEWIAQLNADPVPRLRISPAYKDLMAESHRDNQLKNYLKERIRAGKFLIKCIHQRQQTIEDILKEIIERQLDFLEEGPSKLKPLTMSRVAQAAGVHETTVSRAIANKYVETPWGVVPMKYFFTSGYRTDDGNRMSNTSVKEAIQKLVANEDKTSPLSDTAIVSNLKKEGIHLARRTVAKYRSELNILPSNLRRAS